MFLFIKGGFLIEKLERGLVCETFPPFLTRVIRLVPLHSPQNYTSFYKTKFWFRQTLKLFLRMFVLNEILFYLFNFHNLMLFVPTFLWFSSSKIINLAQLRASWNLWTFLFHILMSFHFPMINSICDRWPHFNASIWHKNLLRLEQLFNRMTIN